VVYRVRQTTALTKIKPRVSAARSVPDDRRISGRLDQHNAVWRSGREAQPIPVALPDRLWVDALSAASIASAPVAVRMFRRSDTLYRLLLDQQRWPRS
jgi:hypothetical protein